MEAVTTLRVLNLMATTSEKDTQRIANYCYLKHKERLLKTTGRAQVEEALAKRDYQKQYASLSLALQEFIKLRANQNKYREGNAGMEALVKLYSERIQKEHYLFEVFAERHGVLKLLKTYQHHKQNRVTPIWHDSLWFSESIYNNYHLLQVSSTSGDTMVSFLPNITKLDRDKADPNIYGQVDPLYTKTTPGRYLTKFFSDILTQEQIKDWANKQVGNADYTLNILDNDAYEGTEEELQQEWYDLYKTIRVDYSCMRGSEGPRAYGKKGNHLGLAYLSDAAGKKAVRTIVYKSNPEGPLDLYVRAFPNTSVEVANIYLSNEQSSNFFEARGFQYGGNLEGVRLALLEGSSGLLLCPYIDGDTQHVSIRSEYLLITSYGEYLATNTDGYIENDQVICEDCGDPTSEDNITYVGDSPICDHCLSRHYVWVERLQEHIHDGDAVLCSSDDEYYHINEVGQDIFLCEETGNYYLLDDLSYTSRGYVSIHHAVDIYIPDPEGNDYAHEDDVVTITNRVTGEERVYHEDSADDIQDWENECNADLEEETETTEAELVAAVIEIEFQPLKKAA
jgi:hypothetical protein